VVLDSKVKVKRSVTLHSDNSFQTTTVLYSHSLGGDHTGTVVVTAALHCHSLGGEW